MTRSIPVRSFLLLFLLLPPAMGAQEPASSSAASPAGVQTALRLERRLLSLDLVSYNEIRERERRAREAVSAVLGRLDQTLASEAMSLGTLETLRDQLAAAREAAHTAEARLNSQLENLQERMRRIAVLEGDSGPLRPADALTGRWRVTVLPQSFTATFDLRLNGTVVSGTYQIDGGGSGSFRGSLAGGISGSSGSTPRGARTASGKGLSAPIGLTTARGEPTSSGRGSPRAGSGPPCEKAGADLLNKDNLLFLMGGLLIGFVSAYLLFEAMATRQPPRLTPALRAQIVTGEDAAGAGGPAGGPTDARVADSGAMGGGAAPGGPGGQGGPAMAEIQQLRAFVEKNPNDAQAVRKLADLNFDIQNWTRAAELYSHYLELKPDDPDVMTDLGITYRGTGKFDQALDQFHQSQKLAPDHWQSYYNEVVVLAFDLKKLDRAHQVLAQLQQMQPANPDVKKLADAVARQRT